MRLSLPEKETVERKEKLTKEGKKRRLRQAWPKHLKTSFHPKEKRLRFESTTVHLFYTNTNKEKSRHFFSKMPLAFRLITQDPLHA